MKTLLCIISISILASCHTLSIENSRVKPKTYNLRTEFNHTGIFGLVNYSDDWRIQKMCGDRTWTKVVLERGTMAALAEGLMTLGGGNSSLLGLANFFWDPLTISWQCANGTSRENEDEYDDEEEEEPETFASISN